MSNARSSLVAATVACWALVACGGSSEPSSPTTAERPSTVAEGLSDASKVVSAQANIFGAGQPSPPAPGGGGAGELPSLWQLPSGSVRTLTFPRVSGRVNPITGHADWNGPAGDGIGPTDVESLGGISGILHATNGMFLVGVFLTDASLADPAPPRLDFTNGMPADPLEPELGQTFLIGDGKGHSYRIPPDATRLFLGFADGYYYQGAPGWYANNDGELKVTAVVAQG